MKPIICAAKDFAYKKGYATEDDRLVEMFKAGVAFAQQWISVDDELPEKYIKVIIKNNNGTFIQIAQWYGDNWRGDEIVMIMQKSIKYWRYIELE